jgi:hypothetical protein
MERPLAWKILTLGAALSGLSMTGAGMAAASEGTVQPAAQQSVTVSAATSAPAPLAIVDHSPESADSPFESPFESADSPFDSPDDTPFDTPDDTPDD